MTGRQRRAKRTRFKYTIRFWKSTNFNFIETPSYQLGVLGRLTIRHRKQLRLVVNRNMLDDCKNNSNAEQQLIEFNKNTVQQPLKPQAVQGD